MTGIHRLARDATQPAVGRDVEAWCSKCGRVLEHIIVAMVGLEVVQVRCRTCSGTHKYKTAREVAKASAEPKRERAPRTATARSVAPKEDPVEVRAARLVWQRSMAQLDRATAAAYAPALQPEIGQLLDHKTFGYGIVEHVGDGKARVLFETGYKLLAVGR